MKILKNIALALLIVGGLNWGLVGLFDFNLVGFLFDGLSTVISRIIYSIVGVAAILGIITWAMPEHDEDYSLAKKYE